MSTPRLQLNHITKEFSGVKALKGVSLTLMPGSAHGLVGENGAGKSTLIKILTGAYAKTSGEIIYEGKTIEGMNPKKAKELGIHCIYQELNIANHLSIAENIFLGEQPTKMLGLIDWKKMNSDAQAVLSSLQIELDPKTMAGELSIAQKQMIEIARAISQNANVLIMDEPTSSLSERETEVLLSLVEKLKSKGVSVIYVSHRMPEIFRVCDTVTILRDGTYIQTLPVDQIDGTNDLVQLMVNRKLEDFFGKTEVPLKDIVIETRKLRKDGIFKDISFSVRGGEILGVAGLVGSGRTEIAEALFGVMSLNEGEILIDGRKVNIKSPREAISNGIGFVTENRKETGLVLKRSVMENISLANLSLLSGGMFVSNKKEKEIANLYKQKLNIKTANLEQRISNLSGGNQQKAILARWMIQKPKVLILDEPCRGVDVGAKTDIYSQITEMAKQGTAIIMISSEVDEIVGMSDRVIVMHEGEISGELSRVDINPDNIINLAFGGTVNAK
ncbi:sugar ABC transporter ATP-binding protein [Sporosarcina sp. ACRSM]|uniref:sugar ABC transporter ATP-binding protein n=1 Tax=Sporosarcina sp. ACRSM TaxID=2918216 RepID=UPI001EF3E311|nr:sugar ABC transporter ATP-binding protein [Sporosarcina sp. ACRSM]